MNNKTLQRILDQVQKEHDNADDLEYNSNVLIVDGLNTFIRAFSAVPMTNTNGAHVGGIIGFLRSIAYTVKTLNPTRLIITFDGKGGSVRRRELYPEYKGKRKVSKLNRADAFSTAEDEHQSMMEQLKKTVDYLGTLPLSLITVENIEADDTMAYIAKQVLTDSKITLMSTDKDFLQLVNDRISVWSPTKKILYTPEVIRAEYQIPPNNFLAYRIMEGDVSDNIPGVGGAKIKTIIKRFPDVLDDSKKLNVDDLIEYAKGQDTKLKVYDNVINNKELLELNWKLMQLDEVVISNTAKFHILSVVDRDQQTKFNKLQFEKMFIRDQLHQSIPNLETWLNQSFLTLDKFVREHNGKKKEV